MSKINNNGLIIEPWGTPNMISCHEQYASDILFLSLRDVR